jgi:hypothetical protein
MDMMLRWPLLVLVAAIASAQGVPQAGSPLPPPDLDRALRARVSAFYDLLVKHQFRQAEEIVAPDTRDIYYEREKPRYMGFELKSIKYSENFTHAEVVTTIQMPAANAMLPGIMATLVTSIWRLIDGAWYWSVPKINVTDLLKSMSSGATDSAPAAPPPLPGNLALATGNMTLPSGTGLPGGMGTPASIPMMGMGEGGAPKLTVDPPEVKLSASSAQKVTITNTGSSPMTLFLLGKIPGVEATFDHATIKEGEKAILSIHAAKSAKDGTLLIGVTETKEMISLPVFVR